jgi:O-antigen/teichoic acid export membrane protein
MRRLFRVLPWDKARAIFAYGLGPALGILSGPILARSLGPEGRGQFSSVMEPLTLAGAVASFGLPAAVTYFIASGHNPRTVLFRSLVVGIPTASITYGLLIMYSGQVSGKQNIPQWLLISAWSLVVLSSVIQILRSYWQGKGSWRRLDAERFFFAVFRFVAVVGVAVAGFRTAGPFVGGALLAFVLAGIFLVSPKLFKGAARAQADASVGPRVFYRYSMSAALGTIAVVGSNRMDQVLLPLVASSHQLGFYAVAVTVAEVPLVCAALGSRNALTLASRGESLRVIFREISPFTLAGLLLVIGLALGAPFYTTLFFGTEFAPSVLPIQILAIGTAFSFITFVSISIVSGWGHPLLSSLIPIGSLSLTGIGFLVIASSMTSLTAAVVSSASQGLASILGFILVWCIHRKRIRRSETDSRIDSYKEMTIESA